MTNSEKFEFYERRDLVGILMLDGLASLLFLLYPYIQLFYLNDFNIIISVIITSIYLLKEQQDFHTYVKQFTILAVLGGIITAFSLSCIYYFLVRASGSIISSFTELLLIWTFRIVITTCICCGLILLIIFIVKIGRN